MESFGEVGDYLGKRPVGSAQELLHVYVRSDGRRDAYYGLRLTAANPECVPLRHCRDGSFVRADRLNGYRRAA